MVLQLIKHPRCYAKVSSSILITEYSTHYKPFLHVFTWVTCHTLLFHFYSDMVVQLVKGPSCYAIDLSSTPMHGLLVVASPFMLCLCGQVAIPHRVTFNDMVVQLVED